MRVNLRVLRVSTLLMADPKRPLWAYFMSDRLQMNIGNLTQVLVAMERGGWLTKELEPNYDRRLISRPQRTLYRITEAGIAGTTAVLSDLKLPPGYAAKRRGRRAQHA